MNTKELLQKYHNITNEYMDINPFKYGHERALYFILQEYEKKITGLIEHDQTGEWFHKAFRQIDVTEKSNIDLAIWTLLKNANLFWKIIHENDKTRNIK